MPFSCWSVATSAKLGQLLEGCNHLLRDRVQLVRVGIFQRVLVLGAADAVIDREILHRLHVERDAGDLGQLRLQAADDLGGGDFAHVERLEVDLDASAVERGVGAIGPDERRKAIDRRIVQQDLGQLLLLFGHGVKGSGCGGLRDALDEARVLGREEALGNRHVQDHREHQSGERDQQGDGLEAQHELQGASVEVDDAGEGALGGAVEAALLFGRGVAQQARRHHGREGERDEGREQDGDGEGDGELAEEASGNVSHEEQRDEHGDQRDGERDDGEADLLGALQRGGHRRLRPLR